MNLIKKTNKYFNHSSHGFHNWNSVSCLFQEKWQLVALICSSFPALTFVLVFFFLPESPVWLVAKNRIEDASSCLMRINRATTPGQVKEELQTLAERTHKNQKRSMSLGTTLKALTRPECYKPLFIMNAFFFFQQITGTFVVIFYAVSYFSLYKTNGVTNTAQKFKTCVLLFSSNFIVFPFQNTRLFAKTKLPHQELNI